MSEEEDEDVVRRSDAVIPGLLFRSKEPFNVENDRYLLESRLETKIGGEDKVKRIEFSSDSMQAYVELMNAKDLEKVLGFCNFSLRKGCPPIDIEHIDLLEVWSPYLVVKGVPDWITDDMLKEQFEAEGGGAKIDSVKKEGNEEVHITFVNSQVALRFPPTTELMGCELQIKVEFSSATEKKILCVRGLPPKLPEEAIKRGLPKHISKHTGYEAVHCQVINGEAYLKFEDSTAVKSILSNPPTTNFFANCTLNMSAVSESSVTFDTAVSASSQEPTSHSSVMEEAPMSRESTSHPIHKSMSNASQDSAFQSMGRTFSNVSQDSTSYPMQRSESNASQDHPMQRSESNASQDRPMQRSESNASQDSTSHPMQRPSSRDSNSSFPMERTVSSVSQDSSHYQFERSSSQNSAFSPNSSLDSMHMQRALGKVTPRESVDSDFPTAGNPVSFSLPDSERCSDQPPSMSYERGGHSLNQAATSYTRIPGQRQQWQDSGSPLSTVPEIRDQPGSRPLKEQEEMVIEDVEEEFETNYSITKNSPNMVSRILVGKGPFDKNHIKYYLKSLMSVQCTVSQFGKTFTARFHEPVDFHVLKELCLREPLDETYTLSLAPLEPTKELLVTNLRKDQLNLYFLQIHFERFSGPGTVTSKKLTQAKNVLVTFKSCDAIEAVLNNKESRMLDGYEISITEYYGFMEDEEEEETADKPSAGSQADSSALQPPPPPLKYSWTAIEEAVSKEKASWLQRNLQDLNEKIKLENAQVTVGEALSGAWLKVEPQGGSEDISDWDKRIERFMKTYMYRYKEITEILPKYRRADIMQHAESAAAGSNVTVNPLEDGTLMLTGDSHAVDEVLTCVLSMMKELRKEVSEEGSFPRRYIKYLLKFSADELNNIRVRSFFLKPDAGKISVTADEEGRHLFWEVVNKEIRVIQEKSIALSSEEYEFFTSEKGIEKIEMTLGKEATKVVYDFEESDQLLYLMGTDSTKLKPIKKKLDKKFTVESKTMSNVDQKKLRFCGDRQWKELIDRIQKDSFVLVKVDYNSQSITITGDKGAIENAYKRISKFLSEQVNVEVESVISLNEWKVIEQNFVDKIEDIKQYSQNNSVQLTLPQFGSCSSDCRIIIKGEPDRVDDINLKLGALKSEVCQKEVELCAITAPRQVIASVLENMEDKIISLETRNKAVIEISSNDTTSKVSTASVSSSTPTKSIPFPISSFITITQGDLLKQQADVYVNSTNTDFDLKSGQLSSVLLKACGDELQKKCSQLAPLKSETVEVTEVQNLNCKYIFHVALPDYNVDRNPERKFRTTVQKILHTAKDHKVKSVAFPSLGVGNLHFPVVVSAKLILEEIVDFNRENADLDMKYHVVVYDQTIYQEFSREYAKRFNSAPPRKIYSREVKSNGGSTRLSVEKSDIAEETTDVVVNTTTEEMKLDNSAVSKAILKKAGSMLQKACDMLVDSGMKLGHGNIVATKSYNMRCKHLFHAHLPPRGSATTTPFNSIAEIVKKCLIKAEEKGAQSISFPAFGFGQGGYSIDDVAKPMLTALRDFGHNTGFKSLHTIRIIIFDPALHKKFFDYFIDFFKVNISQSGPMKIMSSLLQGHHQSKYSAELQKQNGSTSGDQNVDPDIASESVTSTLRSKIYAASDVSCFSIANELEGLVREKYVAEEITHAVIPTLIDADVEKIVSVGRDSKVLVTVMAADGKIQVQGERSAVTAAIPSIKLEFGDIEKSKYALENYEWTSEKDGTIENYSDINSFILERAHTHQLRAVEMRIDDIEVVIDLVNMEERSKVDGSVRKVRRLQIQPSTPLPVTWESQPVENGNPVNMHMFDVAEGTPEYSEAMERFNTTINDPAVKVVKLQRIQNPIEYSAHAGFLDAISRKYPGKKIDVKRLFHGSKEEVIPKIATQGFNRNFAASANAAYYGRGVYFALNASYSAQTKYSATNKDGHQFMFISRVIIGEYTKGTKNMLVAPNLPNRPNDVYDTLVEDAANPTIFVAMTDAQAYPEYLVTFTKKKK